MNFIRLCPPAALFLLLVGFASCQHDKKAWSAADSQAWLDSCNKKFTKDGVEPSELNKVCDCLLDKVQYDYTYEELKTEVVKRSEESMYFNTCDYSW